MIDSYLTGNTKLDQKIKLALLKETGVKASLEKKHEIIKERNLYVLVITPMSKPRMTQRDKWDSTRSTAAGKYFAYKRQLQNIAVENDFTPTNSMRITFYIPFPKSYSVRQKQALALQPHQLKPDIDNLVKGFLDALLPSDCTVWHTDTYKYWSDTDLGKIIIEHI